MIFGYARVSTHEQNLDLQLDALNKHGCDEIVTEKVSGQNSDRSGLNLLMSKLRSGDILVVWKLDRLGRTLKQLIELINELNNKNIMFVSLNESIDTTTANGRLIFNIFASISQFEAEVIRERTLAGLQSARARGRVGGRPKVDSKKIKQAMLLYKSKEHTLKEITAMTGIKPQTLYNYLAKSK